MLNLNLSGVPEEDISREEPHPQHVGWFVAVMAVLCVVVCVIYPACRALQTMRFP